MSINLHQHGSEEAQLTQYHEQSSRQVPAGAYSPKRLNCECLCALSPGHSLDSANRTYVISRLSYPNEV